MRARPAVHPLRGRTADCRGLIVELPGERKLTTNTLLSIGEHSVRVEAFVCRRPDENHEGVYRFPAQSATARLYGVAYTLDNIGDIYPHRPHGPRCRQRRRDRPGVGQVLEAVDNDFNTLLELGFAYLHPQGNGRGGWPAESR